MRKTAPQLRNSGSSILLPELSDFVSDWINDSQIRLLSPRTIAERRSFAKRLLWFLNHRGFSTCSFSELKAFFIYLGDADQDAKGRWGNPGNSRPLRPITIRTYHTQCRVLFNWLVADGQIEASPMERIAAPIARPDQIRPFDADQLASLINAATQSPNPKRDEAILHLLIDTGMRASELCGLKGHDIDFDTCSCSVLGKGNKKRTVYFGQKTRKVLWRYFRESPRQANEAIFQSDRGYRAGEPLTRSGLLQLIHRLGERAGIRGHRCSPHSFRHSFAVMFLREGGSVFTLQQILGHTSLHMTN